jgi:hypothetical protein
MQAAVCFGNDKNKKAASGAAKYKGTKFTSISAGRMHTCGVTEHPAKVVCWGENAANQCSVPADIKWTAEPSCGTGHPAISGPASCTSCDPKGCNKHFTIMDPKTNTGTCSRKPCPMCKPKQCCTAGHKHYVINTENLEGVCIRHNDDCSAVCMPRGNELSKGTLKRRVCSKGCNKILKVPKPNPPTHAKSDADLFDIVVCQVDWRIICTQEGCETSKEVIPIARCGYTPAVWNSGPTCIANHLHADKHPQCPKRWASNAEQNIKSAKCRVSGGGGDTLGEALGAGRRSKSSLRTKGDPPDVTVAWGWHVTVTVCFFAGTFEMSATTNTAGTEELGAPKEV